MSFKIAIPTYQRYNIKTLSLLKEFNKSDIFLFVANHDEYKKYDNEYPNYNIIIGTCGIKAQRNFITNYFNEDTIVVSMDDDILEFHDRQNRKLIDAVKDCVEYLRESDYGLITFPPTANEYFNNENSYTDGMYLCVGVFHMYKVKKLLQLTVDFIEDYERSLLYIKHDGAVIRNWDLSYKHRPYNLGGLETQRDTDTLTLETNKLLYKYGNMISYKYKKDKAQIILKKQSNQVIQLPKTNIFNELISLLEIAKLRKYRDYRVYGHQCNNRKNFPEYNGEVFGYITQRKTGIYCLSANSISQPILYNELLRLGKLICPFEFKTIQLNKNLVCPSHTDSNNIGYSMLVSFGDYTGGEIIIDGDEYNAYCNPIVFNGSLLEHWNKPISSGIKYSLVYF